MILRACLLLLSSALFIGGAAAQSSTGPIVNGRHLQPTQQQIDSRKDNVPQWDRRVQSQVDSLYDEIMRAAARSGR